MSNTGQCLQGHSPTTPNKPMCVIIVKQKHHKMSSEVARTSARINPHGLGVVWLDTFEVTYHRSSEYKVILTDRPFIAHFRYATIGAVNQSNTHPFVCGKNRDELLMMNGTAAGYGNHQMTDSKALAIELGGIPRKDWKQHLKIQDVNAPNYCRFVSINTRTRSFQIYNRELWTYRDGVWYSKDNVLQENLVAVYGTLKKGYSNYRNYLTKATHVGTGKTKDRYPLIVQGLPYLIEQKGKGTNVSIDLFKVSDDTFRSLDRLEGHPDWYIRKEIPVVVNGRTYIAWVYFCPSAEKDFNGRNFVPSYTQQTWRPTTFTFEDVQPTNIRAQYTDDWDDGTDDEDHSPVCPDCFDDLEFDAFSNYHCVGCDAWFTESEVRHFTT